MTTRPVPVSGFEPGIPGFSFADLQDAARLKDLYDLFCEGAAREDPALWEEWNGYRADPAGRPATAVSSLLVRLAPYVSRFIARLFRIEDECRAVLDGTRALDPVFRFKVDLVRRRAVPLRKNAVPTPSPDLPPALMPPLCTADDERLVAAITGGQADAELALSTAACALLDREATLPKAGAEAERSHVVSQIDSIARWVAAHLDDPSCAGWMSFRLPHALDPLHLVEVEHPDPRLPELAAGPERHRRRRDGFVLTDPRMDRREVLSEIHYCVLCHERDKDSCSKGIHAKDGTTSRNALGIPLPGCPLDEKISEMHALRKAGDAVGALALVTLDNPMCAGTGHRICNDCMKACIYQKQDPVNIPQAETGVLTDVLKLPWGLEVYSLLSRWNPLNVRRPYPLPYNGINVLVVGLGPAGYTLSHYLLNEGFGVVGIDGLKIEPLPSEWLAQPIREWSTIYRALDRRVLEGFGGVSEYGITVRWDKNFLTLLHLLLSRRARFKAYGGIRFGGTMPIEDAWAHGFSHVAIAAGAGRPTIIDMKNNLIRGVRKASDFLMALQLTGAFKHESLANLQVRLPALVIGGGLTAVDTATELLAYYPQQVEKILGRFEELSALVGEAQVRRAYDAEELAQLEEFLAHAIAIRAERARAAAAGEPPDFVPLLRAWGGVSVVYRKRMIDSPAYRLNHEEIIKALEEGIGFIENLDPIEAVPDENGHVKAVVFRRGAGTVELPARALLVAAGTSPNVTCEREAPGTFQLDDHQRFFRSHRVVRQADGTRRLEPDPLGFFTSYASDGRFVSYYGDNHPRYAGNVVKAMASAKDGFPHVVALFEDAVAGADLGGAGTARPGLAGPGREARRRIDARVVGVKRLTPTIIEVIVHAPAAARHFHPGQFYRLQNFESGAVTAGMDGDDVKLVMEGIALTGAWVDRDEGLLSMIALETRRVEPAVRLPRAGAGGRRDGADGRAHRDPVGRERPARGRRSRQRGAVLDRPRDARQRQPRHLFCRVQERRGPLQARGDRGGDRPGDLEHRHRRAHRAGPPAGRALPRQHRGQPGRLRAGRARPPDRAAAERRSDDRHRFRPDDGGGEGGARRGPGAVPQARPRRHRQHQLAHAVHDEGSVRAVPAEARRSRHRAGDDHLLLLQPGPVDGPRGLLQPERPAAPEHRPGEAHQPVARAGAGPRGPFTRVTPVREAGLAGEAWSPRPAA